MRMLINQLSENAPELLRDNLDTIIRAYRDSSELKPVVRNELDLVVKRLFDKDEQLLSIVHQS